MTPLDAGIVLVLGAGVGGIAVHHQFWQARQHRIQIEAEAYGGRRDEGDDTCRHGEGE